MPAKGFLGETSWMQEAEATKANERQGGLGRAASLISMNLFIS
jgi:hypothetical protein